MSKKKFVEQQEPAKVETAPVGLVAPQHFLFGLAADAAEWHAANQPFSPSDEAELWERIVFSLKTQGRVLELRERKRLAAEQAERDRVEQQYVAAGERARTALEGADTSTFGAAASFLKGWPLNWHLVPLVLRTETGTQVWTPVGSYAGKAGLRVERNVPDLAEFFERTIRNGEAVRLGVHLKNSQLLALRGPALDLAELAAKFALPVTLSFTDADGQEVRLYRRTAAGSEGSIFRGVEIILDDVLAVPPSPGFKWMVGPKEFSKTMEPKQTQLPELPLLFSSLLEDLRHATRRAAFLELCPAHTGGSLKN